MNKNKILILVNHDIVIYNFRKELVEKLIKLEYEVYITSPYGKRIDYLINMGCNFINSKVNRHGINIIEDLKLISFYNKIIRSINPLAVLTFTIKPNIYGGLAAKKQKIPYIANITGLGTAVEKKGLIQLLTIFLYKRAFTKVNTVFFQNEENKKFFKKKKIALQKHELLPGSGVNLMEFTYIPYPKDKVVHFAFISRIMKDKGIDYYLNAARVTKQKYPNTVFHVCGFCEENYIDILKNYQERNIIIYHGMIEDIRTILKDIHCVIHPSYYPEGMSNVLLEAAASGRPIITTNRSGCKEAVLDKISGFIVNASDVNELCKSINDFINLSIESKEKMGILGREHMKSNFDRKIVVDKYIFKIESLKNDR